MATVSVKVDLNLSKEGFEKGEAAEVVVLAFKGDQNDMNSLVMGIKELIKEIAENRKP